MNLMSLDTGRTSEAPWSGHFSTELFPDDTDGRDWFDSTVDRNRRLIRVLKSSRGSRAWIHSRPPLFTASYLSWILDNLRSLVRNHGVPRNCRVDFATVADDASGCAGFSDAPKSFLRPFIFFDRKVYEECSPEEVVDVYCGLAIHEASHILQTREFYQRQLTQRLRVWSNLWEDERIEALARLDSPGYGPLLEATRFALISRPYGAKASVWNQLSELDRAHALIFGFIRCPHALPEFMRQWQTQSGECLFDRLRRRFPRGPRTEDEVAEWANRTQQIYLKHRKRFPDTPQKFVATRAAEKLADIDVPGVLRQLENDACDRALSKPDRTHEAVTERLLEEADLFEQAACDADPRDADELRVIADRLLRRGLHVQSTGNIFVERENRFSLREMKDLLGATESITRPLSLEEATVVGAVSVSLSEEDDASTLGVLVQEDHWDWDGDRQTIIEYPRPTTEARSWFDVARQAVAGHVAPLRKLASLRKTPEAVRLRDRQRGTLDRSRLWRGAFDDRLFTQRSEQRERGMALCLLIDESGSMWHGEPRKIDVAKQVAAMFVGAFGGIPGIELEVYAHTSHGEENRDCLVRYLFGRHNRDATTIGSFSAGGENYDHQAIATAAKLFRQNTTHANRWLIVLSDGLPSGQGYSGKPAIDATRDVVQSVRRQGIRVLNVAIEDFASEKIFGKDFVLKFTDHNSLVNRMRQLMTTMLRQG